MNYSRKVSDIKIRKSLKIIKSKSRINTLLNMTNYYRSVEMFRTDLWQHYYSGHIYLQARGGSCLRRKRAKEHCAFSSGDDSHYADHTEVTGEATARTGKEYGINFITVNFGSSLLSPP
jgi:hypothetical protein